MCGGIVLMLHTLLPQANKPSDTKKLFFGRAALLQLSYHFGKICTYSIFGFIAGVVGNVAMPSDEAKKITLFLLACMLMLCGLSVCLPRIRHSVARVSMRFFPFLTSIDFSRRLLTYMRVFLGKGGIWGAFMLGLCNGLLPCGVVYFFLLTAMAMGDGVRGAVVMAVFGVASMPPLFMLGLLSASLQYYRTFFIRLSGVSMFGFGIYEMCKIV